MFCPFVKDECKENCVFYCRNEAIINDLVHSHTNCLIVKRINEINYMQFSQLEEIKAELEK